MGVTVNRGMTAGRRPMIWRCGQAAVLASMTVVLASCAAQASPMPRTAAQAGQMRIVQIGVGKAVPIESALSFIRIESAVGASHLLPAVE